MTPSVGEDLEVWDLCALPTASHRSTAPPESSLIVISSTKHTLTTRSSRPFLRNLPKRNKTQTLPRGKTRTSVTLFLRASNWNQPPRPPAGEQVSKTGLSTQRTGICSKKDASTHTCYDMDEP